MTTRLGNSDTFMIMLDCVLFNLDQERKERHDPNWIQFVHKEPDTGSDDTRRWNQSTQSWDGDYDPETYDLDGYNYEFKFDFEGPGWTTIDSIPLHNEEPPLYTYAYCACPEFRYREDLDQQPCPGCGNLIYSIIPF